MLKEPSPYGRPEFIGGVTGLIIAAFILFAPEPKSGAAPRSQRSADLIDRVNDLEKRVKALEDKLDPQPTLADPVEKPVPRRNIFQGGPKT